MSLRILFADDSMTAQNMGKKILSDAGYDVVAVSNGAAAVKKIAEQKPDIIILDVYMPGYSGLEVCEKVRGSLDTLKTPVLLTVGKLEPFKSEDGNRVKADGVIIKPFEASDLLAIIKKFEERIGNAPPPPMVAQPVAAESQYTEEAAAPEPPLEHHSTGSRTSTQPMVEVPDHMAASAAFGDMLGGEVANSTSHFAVNTPAATFETSVIVPAPPVPAADHEVAEVEHELKAEPVIAVPVQTVEEIPVAAPVPDLPVTTVEATPFESTAQPAIVATPEPAGAEPVISEPVAEAPRHPQFIPVFKDPEPAAEAEYTFMPTATPADADLEIPREPALQETAEETTRSTKVDHIEPGLMSTIGQQVEGFSTSAVETAVAAAPPMEVSPAAEIAPPVSYTPPTAAPAIEAAGEVSDSDFEARVAAALSAYNKASEAEMTYSAAASEPAVTNPAVAEPVLAESQAVEPPAEQAYAAAAPIPSFEYQPPVRSAEPVPVANAATAAAGNTYEHAAPSIEIPAQPSPSSLSVEPTAVAASVDAQIPDAAASAPAETAADHHHTIAQAVHRVMERLKPELVEEIMKELKAKK